jgi:cytochrome c
MAAAARRAVVVALAMVLALSGAAFAEGDMEKGARAYHVCYNCHSLEPGVHLTGPSLANLWVRKAGSVEGFGRYSEALRSAEIAWTAETLDAWLKDPQALVPGNTMILGKVEHNGVRKNLIAFLELALGPDGAKEAVARGLLSPEHAAGRVLADLGSAGPEQQVTNIRYCGDAYVVTTADGAQALYWERNLNFKTDASSWGPRPGQPVLVSVGSAGDRASVVFATPGELSSAVKARC